MRKKSMRLVSAALAACMTVSMLPVGAFALDAGAAPENSVSVQEADETTENILPKDKEKTIDAGGTYRMPEGKYEYGIVIDTDEAVIINIEGDINYVNSDYNTRYLFTVKKVGQLTVNAGEHKITLTSKYQNGSPTPSYRTGALSVSSGATGTIVFEGGHYTSTSSNDAVFMFHGGTTATLKNVEVAESYCSVWVANDSSVTLNIDGGKYEGVPVNDKSTQTLSFSGGSVVITDAEVSNKKTGAVIVRTSADIMSGTYTSEEGVAVEVTGSCNIHDGTFKSGNKQTVYAHGSICNIDGGTFEGMGNVIESSSGKTTIAQAANSKTVIRSMDGGTSVKAGVVNSGGATTIINGGTIENAERGIWVYAGDVTLNSATLSGNENDIYLNSSQTITIGENFTDRATVKVAETNIAAKRAVTTAQNPAKRNLVSNDKDTDDRNYLVLFDKTDSHYYLGQRTEGKFTVNPENAKATLEDGTVLDPTTEVAKNTQVNLEAVAPDTTGWEFTGWELIVDGVDKTDELLKDANTKNPHFEIPDTMDATSVTVRAKYNYVGTDDSDAGSSDGAGNAVAAVVVGAAAAWGVYEAGTGIYRVINMPGIAMPSNRGELAMLIWEKAGKPEPASTALYDDIDEENADLQKAAHWAVEQELMDEKADNNFKPGRHVTKLRVCVTWDKAKQKGLFD